MKTFKRLILLVLFFFSGQTAVAGSPEKAVTITDVLNREVEISQPLDRVVVVNTAVAIILRALGVDLGQKLVGVTQYVLENPKFWPGLQDKPAIHFTHPSYETLAELNPQAVFFYETSPQYTSEEKLKALGIPSVYLDGFDPRTLEGDIRLLGRLFQKEKEAEALITWCRDKEEMVTPKISAIPLKDRPRVFYYVYPDANLPKGIYRTCNRTRSSHGLMEKAGVINIAADLPDETTVVSAEWIMEQNPDVIIAGVIGKDYSGYNADPKKSLENLRAMQETLISDRAFRHTRAGKEKRVLVCAQDLKQGPAYVIELAHMAKFIFPDRFPDLDPEGMAKEYYEQWCGLPLQGVFVYPAPEKLRKNNVLSFTDSSGRQISLPLPVKRIAGLHTSAVREFCMLGIQDRVVGVTNYVKDFPGMYPGLGDKPLIGSVYTPLYETILETRPELVVMSSSNANLLPVLQKLEPLGIRVAALDLNPGQGRTANDREARYDEELRILGRIMDRQDRAEAYIQWKQDILDLIRARTRGARQKKVIGINYSAAGMSGKDYPVWAGSRIIEPAGAMDAARQISGATVSPEWILEQDLDAVLLAAYFPHQGMGYQSGDTSRAQKNLDAVKTDRVFSATRAGKTNQIYLFGYYGTASGGQTPLGALYLAKRLYPERFSDIDPEKFHKEYFEKWFHIPFQGVWFYP